MKPSILFVINSLCGGGAERVMSTLLSHSKFKRESLDLHLALLDKELSAYCVPTWVTLHQLDCRFSLVRSIIELRRLLSEIDPACVLSFLTRANVANCLVTPKPCRPAIISERINTDMQLGAGFRGALAKWIVRRAYPKASRTIAVSTGVGEALVRNYGVPKWRVEIIPNPLDIQAIGDRAAEDCPEAPKEPFVMSMGRLVTKKNFSLLLHSFAQSGISGGLVIAGEGPEKEALLKLAEELGIAQRVWLPGFLVNPYSLLSRAHAFVLSSNVEGFPNALVEALSLGIPCIATNCADGPAEILARVRRDEVSGLLQTPCGILVPVDDREAMSLALRQIQETSLRRAFSIAGRARAENFAVGHSVARYWRVIEDVLAEEAPAA